MSIQIRETALTGVLLIEPRFRGVERGLGVLDDQKPRCAESHDPVADFRAESNRRP